MGIEVVFRCDRCGVEVRAGVVNGPQQPLLPSGWVRASVVIRETRSGTEEVERVWCDGCWGWINSGLVAGAATQGVASVKSGESEKKSESAPPASRAGETGAGGSLVGGAAEGGSQMWISGSPAKGFYVETPSGPGAHDDRSLGAAMAELKSKVAKYESLTAALTAPKAPPPVVDTRWCLRCQSGQLCWNAVSCKTIWPVEQPEAPKYPREEGR